MLLRNKTKADITLPSRHVIKAGGSIEAAPSVMEYADNRIHLQRQLGNGSLVLETPKKPEKVKDAD